MKYACTKAFVPLPLSLIESPNVMRRFAEAQLVQAQPRRSSTSPVCFIDGRHTLRPPPSLGALSHLWPPNKLGCLLCTTLTEHASTVKAHSL